MSIDSRSKTEQELLLDSKTEFLPWEVLFDLLRSATLNPGVLQSLSAKLLGISTAVEMIRGFDSCTAEYQFLQFLENLLPILCLQDQFNVVTALL